MMFNSHEFSKKGDTLRKNIEEQNSPSKKLELKFLEDVMHNVLILGKFPDSFRFEYTLPLNNDLIIKVFDGLSIPLVEIMPMSKFKNREKLYLYKIFTK